MRKSLRTEANDQMRQSQNKKSAEENDFESRRALLLPPNWLEKTFFQDFPTTEQFPHNWSKSSTKNRKVKLSQGCETTITTLLRDDRLKHKNRGLKLNLNTQFF